MKKKKIDVLYRVVKFEIHPNEAQLSILTEVNDNLREVWNKALADRNRLSWPLLTLREKARERGDEHLATRCTRMLPFARKRERRTLFDQINQLTEQRRDNTVWGDIPRNWQEETLDRLSGSYLSWISLRKKGDHDARPPRMWDREDLINIPGRTGLTPLNSILKTGTVEIRCPKVSREVPLLFKVPSYQLGKLEGATKIKKFILHSSYDPKQERNRFWISLAYELPKPKEQKDTRTVFIALGASSLGVLSEEDCQVDVWRLERPDKHWMPKIQEINRRSRTKKRVRARQIMFQKLARQNKQYIQEVVARLLKLGTHFVVTDYVVRSKKGKLADSSQKDRGGSPHGLNWAAQNTGHIAALVAQLEIKASEIGGTVTRVKLNLDQADIPRSRGPENKGPMAHLLRAQYRVTQAQ